MQFVELCLGGQPSNRVFSVFPQIHQHLSPRPVGRSVTNIKIVVSTELNGAFWLAELVDYLLVLTDDPDSHLVALLAVCFVGEVHSSACCVE